MQVDMTVVEVNTARVAVVETALAGMEATAEADRAVEVAAEVEVVAMEVEVVVMARAPKAVAAMVQGPTALETAAVVVNDKMGNLGNGTSYSGRLLWMHCTTPCIQRL